MKLLQINVISLAEGTKRSLPVKAVNKSVFFHTYIVLLFKFSIMSTSILQFFLFKTREVNMSVCEHLHIAFGYSPFAHLP